MSEPTDRQDLAIKLLTSFHLSVPERAVFGGKPVPGALIRSGILSVLDAKGSFPPGLQREDVFNGGLIEHRSSGSYTVTWKGEVGMMRFEVVKSQDFPSASAAVASYVSYAERFFGPNIDGVPVDWSS